MLTAIRMRRVLSVLFASGFCVPAASAVVTTLGATVASEVRQTVNGESLNVDTAFDELDLTTFNLPLLAESRLLPSDLDESAASEVGSVAVVATSRFSDPRLNQTETPNEFALHVIGFSDTPDVAISANSRSIETREVTFLPEEFDLEEGTAVEAQSHFFLDGVLVLLGNPGQFDLTGARVEMALKVIQERSGFEPATVLETTVALVGNSDGTATLEVGGALVPENVTTFGLVPGGLIEGVFQVVLMPNLEIPYVYPANVGETFGLRAEISTRFETPPGTGSAAILGDGLSDLTNLLEDVIGDELASQFADGLTIGLALAELPAARLVAESEGTTLKVVSDSAALSLFGPFCGATGAESALLAAGFLGFIAFRSRRRF